MKPNDAGDWTLAEAHNAFVIKLARPRVFRPQWKMFGTTHVAVEHSLLEYCKKTRSPDQAA